MSCFAREMRHCSCAKVSWRPVRLASIGEETAAISAGLRGGERFVALGAHMLHQGEAVRIAGAGR